MNNDLVKRTEKFIHENLDLQHISLVEELLEALKANSRTTFAAFSAANRIRCEHPQGFDHPLVEWSTSDWFVAIMGELGEAANVVKKLNRVRDGIPGNKETPEELRAKLRKEMGDAYVYLDLTAQACGVNLEEAIIEVFDGKSKELGYPVMFGE